MVFEYNLLSRYGVGSDSTVGFGGPGAHGAWGFMIGDSVVPQVGWLYPFALIGLIIGVWRASYLLAVQGSSQAGQYILAGASVLPMGGFSGQVRSRRTISSPPSSPMGSCATCCSTGAARGPAKRETQTSLRG